jgi:hypothetical protein
MWTRIERWQWQWVPSFLFTLVAYFPDEVIGGFGAEPRLQHVADAETLVLTSEEAPRALQTFPELHEAFFVILDLHIKNPIFILTKMTLTTLTTFHF